MDEVRAREVMRVGVDERPPAVYDIVGRDGQRVLGWAAAGGVEVWRNADLGHPEVGALAFTPQGKGPPSWRFRREELVTDPARFRVFERTGVLETFSYTTKGFHAAEAFIEQIRPEEREHTGLVFKVRHAYTIESLAFQTPERVGMADGETRPFWTLWFTCVVDWTYSVPVSE